jgi:hypothetical protein
MNKSIKGTPKKKRGRPPTTGRGTQIGMRWQDPELSAIDEWREKHEVATRPEAIRRLVELGLSVTTKARPTGRLRAALVADLAAEAIDSLGLKVKTPAKTVAKPGRRTRARELATEAIEKISDPAAPPEELEQRRQRLTKGPPEFREARVDQPKAKR